MTTEQELARILDEVLALTGLYRESDLNIVREALQILAPLYRDGAISLTVGVYEKMVELGYLEHGEM